MYPFFLYLNKNIMRLKTIITLITMAMFVVVTSCNRKGCSDPLALNYSEKAKKDDILFCHNPIEEDNSKLYSREFQ